MSKETKEITEIIHSGVGKKTFFFTFFLFFLLFSALFAVSAYFALIKYQEAEAKLSTLSSTEPQIDLGEVNKSLSASAETIIAEKEQSLQQVVSALNQDFAFIKDNKVQLQEENYKFWLDYTLTYWQTSLNPTHTTLLLKIIRDKYEKLNLQKYSSLLASIDKDLEKLKTFPTSLDINTSFDNLFLAIQETLRKQKTAETETTSNPYSIKELAYWKYYTDKFWTWLKSGFSVESSINMENFDEFTLELHIYITQIKLALATQDIRTAEELSIQLREKILARYRNVDKNIFLPISDILDSYKDTKLITKGL